MKKPPKSLPTALAIIKDLTGHLANADEHYDLVATRLRILTLGLEAALPNIEHRGSVRIKRGPGKGRLAHPPPKEVAKALRALLDRVYDESRCNNDCKWVYFCERKKGHKGVHRESGLWWPR